MRHMGLARTLGLVSLFLAFGSILSCCWFEPLLALAASASGFITCLAGWWLLMTDPQFDRVELAWLNRQTTLLDRSLFVNTYALAFNLLWLAGYTLTAR